METANDIHSAIATRMQIEQIVSAFVGFQINENSRNQLRCLLEIGPISEPFLCFGLIEEQMIEFRLEITKKHIKDATPTG